MRRQAKALIRRAYRWSFFKKYILLLDLYFEPYIKELGIEGIASRFLFATPQAAAWYDPVRAWAKVEYEWVLRNIDLRGKHILDAGAHHGHYSVVLAAGACNDCDLVSVDPYPMNAALVEVNLRLNGFSPRVVQCAVGAIAGEVRFTNESNGRVVSDGGMLVRCDTLFSIMPEAEIVKLDVEGAEFDILPVEIDRLTRVSCWIIEVHPGPKGNPEAIVGLFRERGWQVLWVDRRVGAVVPYALGAEWRGQSTLVALRSK